jgi:hypothetical protein
MAFFNPEAKGAIISKCLRYRYKLTRGDQNGRVLHWIMLNPSIADAFDDDQTIRKCTGFANRLGYSAISVHNLFAIRATDPRDMLNAADPVGPENASHLQIMLDRAAHEQESVICAWGQHGTHMDQDETVMGWIDVSGVAPLCLGRCVNGTPRHPLMLSYKTPLSAYGGRYTAALIAEIDERIKADG